MAFDPNYPVDHMKIVAADFRNQFNSLKAIIDAQQSQIVGLQQQLAPLVPVLIRSAAGQWTLSYAGSVHDSWQIWARSSGNPTWSATGEIRTAAFPATDGDMAPSGETWWQVKICGEDGDGNQATPFSNVISYGPVPA